MTETMHQIYDRLVASGEIQSDPAQVGVLALFEQIREELSNSPEPTGFFGKVFGKPKAPAPKGAYVWGGVGRGKSFLMDLFFEHAPVDRKRRVHFHAFMQEIHAGLTAARKTGVDDALRPVAEQVIADAQLLCFDEMQITDITDAMLVGRLFQALFDAGVVVVTTSNRVPDDLYKDGLNRQLFVPFIELIKERMHVHELVSDTDYRQTKLQGTASYFVPADAQARDAMDAVWTDLVGKGSDELTLIVNKREVVIPNFKNGVARVDFWDLCGRPLGAADYLTLTEAVRVLMIENVPHLSQYNFNEAKRFVTLVDTLYEARTKVFFSAADVPERLYLEGEGVFEFERTASRLREMQGEEWGL